MTMFKTRALREVLYDVTHSRHPARTASSRNGAKFSKFLFSEQSEVLKNHNGIQ